MFENLMPILIAIIAAALYAASGYLKQTKKFNEEKLYVTIVTAIIVAATSFIIGSTYDLTTQLLVSIGAIATIEMWGKAIYRRFKSWLDNI